MSLPGISNVSPRGVAQQPVMLRNEDVTEIQTGLRSLGNVLGRLFKARTARDESIKQKTRITKKIGQNEKEIQDSHKAAAVAEREGMGALKNAEALRAEATTAAKLRDQALAESTAHSQEAEKLGKEEASLVVAMKDLEAEEEQLKSSEKEIRARIATQDEQIAALKAKIAARRAAKASPTPASIRA